MIRPSGPAVRRPGPVVALTVAIIGMLATTPVPPAAAASGAQLRAASVTLDAAGSSDGRLDARSKASDSVLAPRLKVRPQIAAPGEVVTVTGRLATTFPRAVELTSSDSDHYLFVRGTTSRSGQFTLRFNAVRSRAELAETIHVTAPTVKRGGRRYPEITFDPVRLRTVAQSVTVTFPDASQAQQDQPVRMVARFSPARPGRKTQLQMLRDGSWQSVATGAQDAGGRSTWSSMTGPGPWESEYRARTVASHGAAAVVSPSIKTVHPVDEVWAGNDRCVDLLFVGARGSGQPWSPASWGLGPEVFGAWQMLLAELPAGTDVAFAQVDYPALSVDVLPGQIDAYLEGLDSGVESLASFVRSRSGCPDEQHILAGMSQGAMVMHRAMWDLVVDDPMDARDISSIVGFLAMGDGDRIGTQGGLHYGTAPTDVFGGIAHLAQTFGEGGRTYKPRNLAIPDVVADHFHDVCIDGDPVCRTVGGVPGGRWWDLGAGGELHAQAYREGGSGPHGGAAVPYVREAILAISNELPATGPPPVPISRVSIGQRGVQADDESETSAISGNGRFVAFGSFATNLVRGDTNGSGDVFVHDRQTGTTTRISVASSGKQANNFAGYPALSQDGRFVAFNSSASNLVPGDTNGSADVFVHDRQTGTTTRISVASDGEEADDGSGAPAISATGRFITFESSASNLVNDDTNASRDVFVHDRQTGTTTRVSIATDGTEANAHSINPVISADGSLVAFETWASNLSPEDQNYRNDVVVHDLHTGTTTLVSVSSSGVQGREDAAYPALSPDGRFVAFMSTAPLAPGTDNGFSDVFVHDLETGSTTTVSAASDGTMADDSTWGPIFFSFDGRFVAYQSVASNLVLGDTNRSGDAFLHDRRTGRTLRVSVAGDGSESNDRSLPTGISFDGRSVSLLSFASNLVDGDTNDVGDVFVVDVDAQ